MQRRDGIILLAVWAFITAFGALIGIISIGVFPIATAVSYNMHYSSIFGLSIGVLVLSGFLAFAVMTGIGLLKMREWGRILGIVHAALLLILIPVGTVIGVLALLYLTRPDVREAFLSPGGNA